MDPKEMRATMDDIDPQSIIDDAKAAAEKDGQKVSLKGGRHVIEPAVDPEAVAAGEDDDELEDDPEGEPDEGKKGKAKDDDDEPYIPEIRDDEPEGDDKGKGKKPDDKDEPIKPAGTKGNPAVDDEELAAFEAELKAEGWDEDSVKLAIRAAKLGGQVALKKMDSARQAEREASEKQQAETQKAFTERRLKQYQVVGKLQQDGVLPKVPAAIQKKIVDGLELTEKELEHPGVKRQNEVWEHMANTNKAARAAGEEPYLLDFRTALADLEASEARAAKVTAQKGENSKHKQQSKMFKASGGGGDDTKGKGGKPKYISGQSLEDVTQEILAELN